MRWMVELGHVDINTKVSLLSLFLTIPRQGYLKVVLDVMSYLKLKHNSPLSFDPTYLDIDQRNFRECVWKDFYKCAVKAIPPNAPLPRCNEVHLYMLTDSNHAGDKWTR